MNLRLVTQLLFFAIFAVVINPVMAADNLEILSPPDMASVGGRIINIVCKINQDSLDTIRVTSNYEYAEPQPEKPVAVQNTLRQSLLLKEGENKIRIQGLKAGKVVEEKVLSVFRRFSFSMDNVSLPPGFKEYFFHTKQNEKYCRLCHENELRKGAKSMQDEHLPACFTCHKRVMDVKKAHGPAAVWACEQCHMASSEQRTYGVPAPAVNVCSICHTEAPGKWKSEPSGHAPTIAGKCTLCHDPHGSDETFFLKKEATDLCGTCHEDKLKYPHVITKKPGVGHPVKLGPDRFFGKPFSCASCHNPHAENNPYLLMNYNGSKLEFCKNCHR
ncbi:cytochrome c3 family protein [Thermodesulfobacteriota bacterium]